MTEKRFSLLSSSIYFPLYLLACPPCALACSWRLSMSANDLFGLHSELSSTIGPQMAAHMTGTASGGSASPAATANRTNKMALMAQSAFLGSSNHQPRDVKCRGVYVDRSKMRFMHVMRSRRGGTSRHSGDSRRAFRGKTRLSLS
ncbi:hypothetical protein V8C26DRAFT_408577 [Trichoderma gracile]